MRVASCLFKSVVLAGVAVCGGCTYGQVTFDGDPVVNATVRYTNCSADSWQTQTDGSGWYGFDGHENDDEAIPDGPMLIRVDLPSDPYSRYEYANHYFTPCPDGSGRLCDRHDIDFGDRPATAGEWEDWIDDLEAHNSLTRSTFWTEICVWAQL